MLDLIKQRPVRFVFFLESLLGAGVLFGLPLTEIQLGGSMLAVNAFFAFWLDGYTTPVDRKTGAPINPNYMLSE